jgi:hypothetical protein
VGNVREQLAAQAVGFLQGADLLLAARQPQCGLGRFRLLLVETDQLGVRLLQLPRECLRLEQRDPPARGQESDPNRRRQEGRQVHEVLLVGDGPRVERLHEEIVDTQKADGAAHGRRPQASQHADDRDQGQVEEDVVALRLVSENHQRGGDDERPSRRRGPHREVDPAGARPARGCCRWLGVDGHLGSNHGREAARQCCGS